jgi:hypothetical protein
MSPDVVLGTIIVIPIAILVALRINATLVFLSLCLGNILVQFVANDANSFLTIFSAKGGHVANQNDMVKLVLLLLPVLLTTVFMIKTVKGKSKLLLNILPAAGVGLLGALLAVPLLPPGLEHNILRSTLWHSVEQSQNLIVGASSLVCLFVLWLQRPKTGHDGKHRGKHH